MFCSLSYHYLGCQPTQPPGKKAYFGGDFFKIMLTISSVGDSSHFRLPPFSSLACAEPLDIHRRCFLLVYCQHIIPEKSLCPALLFYIDVGEFTLEGS